MPRKVSALHGNRLNSLAESLHQSPQPRLKRKSSIWWKIDLISAALLGASSPQCPSQQVWHNVGFWPINQWMNTNPWIKTIINFTDDWDCMVCLHCSLTNTSQIDDVNYGYTLKLQGIPRMQTSLKLVINTYTITYLILSTCTMMILIYCIMFLSPQWYSKLCQARKYQNR